MNRNAQSVVAGWRAGVGRDQWGTQAHHLRPSEVNYLLASAWSDIAKYIDDRTDDLSRAGFKPGHSVMGELRGLASSAAQRAQVTVAWALDLEEAENEELPE